MSKLRYAHVRKNRIGNKTKRDFIFSSCSFLKASLGHYYRQNVASVAKRRVGTELTVYPR